MDTREFLKENVKYPKSWWIFMLMWLFLGGLAWYLEVDHAIFKKLNSWVEYFPYEWVIVITHMGSFYFIAALILVFLWFYRPFPRFVITLLAATQLLPLILVQLAKQLYNAPRPITVYGEEFWFQKVPEVWGHTQSYWLSFPSGHTEGITALFSIIVLMAPACDKQLWVTIGIVNIILVAFSRLYLSQHFFVDIWVGGVIGLWSGAIIYAIYQSWVKRKLS